MYQGWNKMRRLLILTFAAVAIWATPASDALAQQAWSPTHKIRKYRFLGLFVGDGYHVCTPGHDSSWYSPYSTHNQELYIQRNLADQQSPQRLPLNSGPFRDTVPANRHAGTAPFSENQKAANSVSVEPVFPQAASAARKASRLAAANPHDSAGNPPGTSVRGTAGDNKTVAAGQSDSESRRFVDLRTLPTGADQGHKR